MPELMLIYNFIVSFKFGNMKSLKKEALEYHRSGRKGKIEVIPSKPYSSQRDLSPAYCQCVAEPCLEISKKF